MTSDNFLNEMNHSAGESGDSSTGLQDETILLSRVIQLLGKKHTVLLSDLGAVVPTQFRACVKEAGSLQTWLQKFPALLQVSGQAGKECVTLILGDKPMGSPDFPGTSSPIDQQSFISPPAPRVDISHVTRDQVRQEIEDYIKETGRNRLLLSMLGAALSQEVRTFVKKIDHGLKNSLAQYPHIFHVEGTKGHETVFYLPDFKAEAGARSGNSYENNKSPPLHGTFGRCSAGLGSVEKIPVWAPVPFPANFPAPSVQESCILKIQHSEDEDNSTTGTLWSNLCDLSSDSEPPATPRSPKVSQPPATPESFRTPSCWDSPMIVPDDKMPMQWTIPSQTAPQPPLGVWSCGGFESAPQSCAPQPWVSPGLMIPLFPTWLPVVASPQGNCSVGLDPMATAAALAPAVSKGRECPLHDGKEYDKDTSSEDQAQAPAECVILKAQSNMHDDGNSSEDEAQTLAERMRIESSEHSPEHEKEHDEENPSEGRGGTPKWKADAPWNQKRTLLNQDAHTQTGHTCSMDC